jgi:cation transport regulator
MSIHNTRKCNKQFSSKKGSQNTRLSARPEKQVDSIPVHAKHIFKKTHDSAVEQYQDPEKSRPIELV